MKPRASQEDGEEPEMESETAAGPVSLPDVVDGVNELISTVIGVSRQLYDMAASAEDYPLECAYWNMRSSLLEALRKVSVSDVRHPDLYALDAVFAWAWEGKEREGAGSHDEG